MPDFTPDYFSAHLTDDPAKEPIAVGESMRESSQMLGQKPDVTERNFRSNGSPRSNTRYFRNFSRPKKNPEDDSRLSGACLLGYCASLLESHELQRSYY
jgi:hypothetical protein